MDTQKRLTECLDEFGTDCGEKIRQSPMQAVLVAGGIGYLLRFIPVFSILGILIRVAFALVRPALVIFGIAQITKCLSQNCAAHDLKAASESDLEFPRPLDS